MNEIQTAIEQLIAARDVTAIMTGLKSLVEQLQTKISARSSVLQDKNPETYAAAAAEVMTCLRLEQTVQDTLAKVSKIDESLDRAMKRLARSITQE